MSEPREKTIADRLAALLPSGALSRCAVVGAAALVALSFGKERLIRLVSTDKPTIAHKALYAICTIWFFGETFVVALCALMLQIPLAVLPFDPNRMLSGRLFRLAGVMAVKLNPLWDFRVHGRLPPALDKSRNPGKTVVVSNHESLTDPFLISHLPFELKWLSKRENFRIPIVGWSMALAGDISLNRGNKDSAKGAMGQCATLLGQDVPVCIFPEGTRSQTRELLPFKDGAFRLAIETGADILPIAVAGSGRAMRKHSKMIYPSIANVTVGTPISTKGMGPGDVDRLKAEALAQIQGMRKAIMPHSSM